MIREILKCVLYFRKVNRNVFCSSTYLVWRSADLKQFVVTLKEAMYLMSKTVRLVQEVDLIAKGFVL